MDAGRFANFKSVSATFSLLNGDGKNPFSHVDFTKFGADEIEGDGGGSATTFGETQFPGADWGSSSESGTYFQGINFTQFGATDCCPDLTATAGTTSGALRNNAYAFAAYVFKEVFISAHIPNHANYAWRYTGTTPLTLTEVKAQYKIRKKENQTGSYTRVFGNDQKYHGKGSLEGMYTSAILKMTMHQTTLKSFEWIPSISNREAFKDEYRRMQTDRIRGVYEEGYRNPINYNLRNSPGKKYILIDGY